MADMGIGLLGSPQTIIKRKFRFTIEIQTPIGNIPIWYVKIGAKPQLQLEETEIHFRNAVHFIPGKARWQPITIQYYDVADGLMAPLYNWVASVYDFMNPSQLSMSEKCGWNATVLIRMYDGCGALLETWELFSAWPTTIDFGDSLDYANSEFSTIQLTIRYSDAKMIGGCRTPTPAGRCCGC